MTPQGQFRKHRGNSRKYSKSDPSVANTMRRKSTAPCRCCKRVARILTWSLWWTYSDSKRAHNILIPSFDVKFFEWKGLEIGEFALYKSNENLPPGRNSSPVKSPSRDGAVIMDDFVLEFLDIGIIWFPAQIPWYLRPKTEERAFYAAIHRVERACSDRHVLHSGTAKRTAWDEAVFDYGLCWAGERSCWYFQHPLYQRSRLMTGRNFVSNGYSHLRTNAWEGSHSSSASAWIFSAKQIWGQMQGKCKKVGRPEASRLFMQQL